MHFRWQSAWLQRLTLRNRNLVVRDAVPALLLIGVGWFGTVMQLIHGNYYGSRGWVLASVSAFLWALEHGPIAFRRRAPRAALAVVVTACLGATVFAALIGRENSTPSIALAVLCYSVVTHLERRRAAPRRPSAWPRRSSCARRSGSVRWPASHFESGRRWPRWC